MALFQSSVLKDHLRLQEEQQVDRAYKKFTAFFHNPEIQENIRGSKEEQFQATFLSELFVKVLGYTMNPQPGYDLTTEFKNNKNARKADGAILKDGLAIGVIELKGTNTKHLEGIRQQAFDYKVNQKGCVYVVTSNFEKLRFYINDATEFIEFDLFELTPKDFSLLYLCLHKDNIYSHRPLKIKEASLVEEEVITKQFYKDYSIFKRELFRDLVLRNVDRIKKERILDFESSAEKFEAETKKQIRLSLFKKSQKLIDRFLFIFFAEDRGLLPPNSIHRIIADWNKLKDLDAETPLYKRFQLYFSYLDTGRKGTDKKAEIFAYNGGLFKPDPILDSIEIDDDLLYKHTARLATYDFESQVDVNILGHIFENSLNEIESVHAEIEGADFDKQKSKRKKDGVFYTPKYITKYIVENTVGRLCEEKKSELGFREEEYYKGRKRRQKETLEGLIKILDDYRDWLLKLTICDPACGSGAFLNQALDFLIKEHRYIDELKHKLLGGGLVFSDIETTILENNIYGVDINEESVEIAKLSLWLRTAQPRRKLNDLSSNIKCGNSLIDDPKVAGNKAFKWEEEFSDVFAKGGFDVVIGNPPYVTSKGENFSKEIKEYFLIKYKYSIYQIDLYLLFLEKSLSLIHTNGISSLIIPNAWLNNLFLQKVRQLFMQVGSIYNVVNMPSGTFLEANVDTIIITYGRKKRRLKIQLENCINTNFVELGEVDQNKWINSENSLINIYLTDEISDIIDKINRSSGQLEDITEIGRGVGVYHKRVGHTKEFIEKDPYQSEEKKDHSFIPYLKGRHLSPWNVVWDNNNFISYGKWLAEPRHPSLFDGPRIVLRQIPSKKLIATYLEKQFVTDQSVFIARFNSEFSNIAKSCTAIINSSLAIFYFRFVHSEFDDLFPKVKLLHFKKFPIHKSILSGTVNWAKEADKILELSEEKRTATLQFQKFLKSSFLLNQIPSKLQSWHQLEFGDFIKELNKAIKTSNKERTKEGLSPVPLLSRKDEFEWMELFEESKKKAQELQMEIEKTDDEIDRMVNKLYGLTEEEIEIVENS